VITLVAVVLLFVVGAMAALAIDVATFYTARSEVQLAADSAALTGARALANSGMTSNPADSSLIVNAKSFATTLALQVATQQQVGGRPLVGTTNCVNEVCVTFNDTVTSFGTNPQVTVTVKRTDLPTFFARIWGNNSVAVQATAVAEAYNPSGLNATAGAAPPVALRCVKPWVLPNISPIDGTTAIFDTSTGAIQNASALLGWTDPNTSGNYLFYSACTGYGCSNNWPPPAAWRYYPGTTSDASSSFPPPTQALPSCSDGFNPYQLTIAGCVTTPFACNAQVNLDQSAYFGRNRQTSNAVNCLAHCESGAGNPPPGDEVTVTPPSQSFQFLGGTDNPIAGAVGKTLLVSDSLVTVPVYNSNSSPPSSQVTIIGFVQLFLNSDGEPALTVPPHANIRTTIVNLVGCGTNATGSPNIYGNGASAVAVRLIRP
jgi:Flp pilus assembly protein TadG